RDRRPRACARARAGPPRGRHCPAPGGAAVRLSEHALRGVARAACIGLLVLQLAWHGWLHPPRAVPPWLLAAVVALPLLLVLPGVLRLRVRALFWAGLASLLYFCHGVAELWSAPAARVPALAEITLALLLVSAVGLAGLRRRRLDRA